MGYLGGMKNTYKNFVSSCEAAVKAQAKVEKEYSNGSSRTDAELLDLSGSECELMGGCSRRYNETSVSIKCDELSGYCRLKKCCVRCEEMCWFAVHALCATCLDVWFRLLCLITVLSICTAVYVNCCFCTP